MGGAYGLRALLWAPGQATSWETSAPGSSGLSLERSCSQGALLIGSQKTELWEPVARGEKRQQAACDRCMIRSCPAAKGQSSPVSGCPTPHPLVYSHQTTLQTSAGQRDQERDPQAGSQQGSRRSGSSPVFTDFDSLQATAAPAPEPQTRACQPCSVNDHAFQLPK